MKIHKSTIFIIFIIAFIGAIVMTFTGNSVNKIRPADLIVKKHLDQYNEQIGPALPIPAPQTEFLRSLEPTVHTDTELRFDFKSAPKDEIQASQVAYTVEKLNLDLLPTDGPYVLPIAIGIARENNPSAEIIEKWADNSGTQIKYSYYDLQGNILPEEKLPLNHHRKSRWIQRNRSSIQIVYEVHNLDHPRHVGSELYDVATLAPLNNGSSWSHRFENPYEVSHNMNVYHPVQMRWLVDIAHGPRQQIDIPLKKNAEAILPDVFIRILTDPFIAYSNSSSWGNESVEYRFDVDSNHKQQCIAVGMTPKSMGHLVTAQFLDKDSNPIGSETSIYGNDYVDLLSNYTKHKAEYLRIYRYAGVKRFIVDIGTLPDTPKQNDNIVDLMEVNIPFVYLEYARDAEDIIKGATQLDFYFNNIPHDTLMPQTQYQNTTPTKLLEELQTLSPSDAEIVVDTNQGQIKLVKPRTMEQIIIDWLKNPFK
ncbi:MAG: hypothetical protein JEZ07_09490 [Phycisphaerae bacterium]|nr:hypothetical protein [Phycisphaerae bacterium]